jgi:hypothetical protein
VGLSIDLEGDRAHKAKLCSSAPSVKVRTALPLPERFRNLRKAAYFQLSIAFR